MDLFHLLLALLLWCLFSSHCFALFDLSYRSLLYPCPRLASRLELSLSPEEPYELSMESSTVETNCVRSAGQQEKCVPCSSLDESHALSEDEINLRVQTLPLWSVGFKTDESHCYLFRRFTAKNFRAALDAINAMGEIAEDESHHPDFHLTNYRGVLIEIWTHKLRGVTENDIVLAQKLDNVKIEYSPKWLREHPAADWTSKPNQN